MREDCRGETGPEEPALEPEPGGVGRDDSSDEEIMAGMQIIPKTLHAHVPAPLQRLASPSSSSETHTEFTFLHFLPVG